MYGNKIQGLTRESVKHESEAGQAFHKSLKSQIANFETVTAMVFKFQEVANFGTFFHVMQTIHSIHVMYDKNKDTPL